MILFEQRQPWSEFTRYIIANRHASIQLEVFPKVQDWGGRCWMYGLFTDPQHRRKYYAREVLGRAEQLAKEEHCDSITIEWRAADTPKEVLEWYMRLGYKIYSSPTKDGTIFCLRKRFIKK